jgi:hypothetical protein
MHTGQGLYMHKLPAISSMIQIDMSVVMDIPRNDEYFWDLSPPLRRHDAQSHHSSGLSI